MGVVAIVLIGIGFGTVVSAGMNLLLGDPAAVPEPPAASQPEPTNASTAEERLAEIRELSGDYRNRATKLMAGMALEAQKHEGGSREVFVQLTQATYTWATILHQINVLAGGADTGGIEINIDDLEDLDLDALMREEILPTPEVDDEDPT